MRAAAAVVLVRLEFVHEIRVFEYGASHLEKRETVFEHLAGVLTCCHSADIDERIVRHCRLELERILQEEQMPESFGRADSPGAEVQAYLEPPKGLWHIVRDCLGREFAAHHIHRSAAHEAS